MLLLPSEAVYLRRWKGRNEKDVQSHRAEEYASALALSKRRGSKILTILQSVDECVDKNHSPHMHRFKTLDKQNASFREDSRTTNVASFSNLWKVFGKLLHCWTASGIGIPGHPNAEY